MATPAMSGGEPPMVAETWRANSSSASASSASSFPSLLQFAPFSSAVDVSFWTELARLKLDILQLSSAPLPLAAAFTTSTHQVLPPQLLLGSYSFDCTADAVSASFPSSHAVYSGRLYNANTIDQFRAFDSSALMDGLRDELWQEMTAALTSSSAPSSASSASVEPQLNRFLLLTFADLKNHRYYYWFAIPALVHPELSITAIALPQPASAVLPAALLPQLLADVNVRSPPPAFFIVTWSASSLCTHPLSSLPAVLSSTPASCILLAFIDPSSLPAHPGWPLRNLLLLAAAAGMTETAVLCYRDLSTQLPAAASSSPPLASIVLRLKLQSTAASTSAFLSVRPRCVGYERNTHGKLAPRMIDLSALMSPLLLASASVDLNLRLMRWRQLPALDLPVLASTRCLLLGAGTLGCAVARLLLAWGVRRVTLVDSGTVSYSNPVRQSLYRHEDCVGGGKGKAECAAERLKEIYPGVEAVGVRLSIPMVGHWSEKEEAEMRSGVTALEALVKDSDAVFLLTDSRESRWLPTVLCAGLHRIAINAALGFDSYVVMRHGDNHGPLQTAASSSPPAVRLGCYFCNDIVAPTDSSRDRTLDQQCTVTRPGLAYIASALAVELLVNVLHHPLRQRAPPSVPSASVSFSGLSCVPHQLRGFLSSFDALRVVGEAFLQCTACSEPVVRGYCEGGSDWLMAALRGGPDWLEELSGLTAMKQEMERRMEETDWAVEDDDQEDGNDAAEEADDEFT